MAIISSLPHDAVIEVSKQTSPRTLLALLTTCKHFYEGFYEDFHIWLYQLLLSPVPMARIDPQTMAVAELRKLVTKPYRFELLLQQPLLQDETFTIKKRLLTDAYSTFFVKVVPGGRWLVIAAMREPQSPGPPFRLQIWDLHNIGDNDASQPTIDKPYPAMVREVVVQPGTQADGILVVVRTMQNFLGPDTFEALEFLPTALPTPQIVVRSQVTIPCYSPMGNILAEGPYIAVGCRLMADDSQGVFVWNWLADTWAYISNPAEWVLSANMDRLTLWNRDASIISRVGPLSEILAPRRGATDPPVLRIPPLEEIHPLQEFPENVPILDHPDGNSFFISPTGWSTDLQPATILVECTEALIQVLDEGNSVSSRRYRPLPHEMMSITLSTTISGRSLLFSESCTATVMWGSGETTRTKWERPELGAGWGRAVPFACPLSGVVGIITRDGVISLWMME